MLKSDESDATSIKRRFLLHRHDSLCLGMYVPSLPNRTGLQSHPNVLFRLSDILSDGVGIQVTGHVTLHPNGFTSRLESFFIRALEICSGLAGTRATL